MVEATAEEQAGLSALHPEIVRKHVLARLDGPALGCAACCSASLWRMSSSGMDLWSNVCHDTWPSTKSPRLSQVISTFPNGGPRAFFSHAFPVLADETTESSSSPSVPPPELISAVDIHHRGKPIFTGVRETETMTGWFQCSPFRIDLVDPKDAVVTPIKHPDGDESCAEITTDMTLSWILIDPIGRRALNLSSHKPVAVHRHWLTEEVHVLYASTIATDRGHVECRIVVTCGGAEGEGVMLMQVREVSLQMEDMDGKHLSGKDSLVFLQGALEGKKGTGKNRVQTAQRRYNRFVEMKRERKEKKMRAERALDTFCVAFGLSTFVLIWCLLWCR